MGVVGALNIGLNDCNCRPLKGGELVVIVDIALAPEGICICIEVCGCGWLYIGGVDEAWNCPKG